ncbi:MAG: ArsB/NhaD family transporter [Woeseiaceae bacterium]|nr:ArsB/NhaD family transporter [Woeseiaceae bacterium]
MEQLIWNNDMLASGIILAVTFAMIFTEQLHGIERSKVALCGALGMIIVGQIFGFYDPEAAIDAIDWNVIFLLAGMMTIVSVMIPTGGFDWMAYKIAALSKGRQFFMLVLLGTSITVLSLLLDNVTTVVIFGPLIILIAKAQKISPVPYLLGAALLADTGGIATLVGDPPNIMIGSAAEISFNNFAIHMFPITLVSWLVVLFLLKILFKKELAVKPADANMDEVKVADPRLWKASIAILLIMVGLFMAHNALHWEPWFVAILGMTGLLMVSRSVEVDRALEHVEFTLLIFFMGLFMIIGGVEHSQFLKWIGMFITPFVESDLLLATILLMWVGAFLSAAIDNIPFTAAMIPIILGMEAQGIPVAPLWWGLAMGVGLGGNGTHIGSTANVFIVTISERLARETGDKSLAITPGLWFRKGFPVMLITLCVSTVLFWVFFDFYAQPVN